MYAKPWKLSSLRLFSVCLFVCLFICLFFIDLSFKPFYLFFFLTDLLFVSDFRSFPGCSSDLKLSFLAFWHFPMICGMFDRICKKNT